MQRDAEHHVRQQEADPPELVAERWVRQVDGEAEPHDEDEVGEHGEDVTDGNDAELKTGKLRRSLQRRMRLNSGFRAPAFFRLFF